MKPTTLIMTAILAAAVAGCNSKPAAPAAPAAPTPKAVSPIAIVDLRQVDKAMGWDVEMQQAMIVANQEFREVLSRRLTELADESTDFRAQIAKEAHLNSEQTNRLQHADNSDKLAQLPLTDNQKQRLMTEGLQMALKLEEAQQNYRQQMADAQTKLVESYASQIMPTAKRVATQGGFKVVKIDGDDVLYHDPSTDLTQEVIRDKVKAKPSWEQQPAATQE